MVNPHTFKILLFFLSLLDSLIWVVLLLIVIVGLPLLIITSRNVSILTV